MTNYYLELSDENGGNAHKFYEVTIDNTTVTITYGRIGTDGTASTQNFPTNTDADKFAQKKVNDKKRKGYTPATKGVRLPRTITRRIIISTHSTSKHRAPILWNFRTGSGAFGIYVDEKGCWVGNQKGQVFKLNHEAEVQVQFQLSEGVKCIVADSAWIYIGCDDGNVYDISGKMPRLAYTINPNIDIFWLDIKNGLLAVSDSGGNLTTINYEDEEQWTVKTAGSAAWMVRCDAFGRIFYGDSAGVSSYYGWENGKLDWQQKTSSVLFGWYDSDHVYASTSDAKVHKFTKEGVPLQIYKADAAVFSCATSPNGIYIFAGDSASSIYCFAAMGERLWKLATGCGSAYSMQYFQEKLYIVTTDGSFACIDVSESSIQQVQEGTTFTTKTIKAPTETIAMVQSDALEVAPPTAQGVILKCIGEGAKLKIKVETPGYNDWNVQFPKNIRVQNQRYLVDGIEPATQGDFYRVLGNIYLLNDIP